MIRLLTVFFLIPLFFACKKETVADVLPEIQYKIVNNGDTLVDAFVVWSTILLADGRSIMFRDQAFNGVRPIDTLTMGIYGLQENSKNFIGAFRQFKFRVVLKRKIFSQFHFDNNYIEGGDPYAYGWTQNLNFVQELPDTVKNITDKIFYINWPGDSAKLKQVVFF